MADATYAEILTEAKNAMKRLLTGAVSVTVNGQQFTFASLTQLQTTIDFCERKVAEAAGTDGRGAWEATFSEQD